MYTTLRWVVILIADSNLQSRINSERDAVQIYRSSQVWGPHSYRYSLLWDYIIIHTTTDHTLDAIQVLERWMYRRQTPVVYVLHSVSFIICGCNLQHYIANMNHWCLHHYYTVAPQQLHSESVVAEICCSTTEIECYGYSKAYSRHTCKQCTLVASQHCGWRGWLFIYGCRRSMELLQGEYIMVQSWSRPWLIGSYLVRDAANRYQLGNTSMLRKGSLSISRGNIVMMALLIRVQITLQALPSPCGAWSMCCWPSKTSLCHARGRLVVSSWSPVSWIPVGDQSTRSCYSCCRIICLDAMINGIVGGGGGAAGNDSLVLVLASLYILLIWPIGSSSWGWSSCCRPPSVARTHVTVLVHVVGAEHDDVDVGSLIESLACTRAYCALDGILTLHSLPLELLGRCRS